MLLHFHYSGIVCVNLEILILKILLIKPSALIFPSWEFLIEAKILQCFWNYSEFLFLHESVLIIYTSFLGICPTHLSFQISWHIIVNICLLFLKISMHLQLYPLFYYYLLVLFSFYLFISFAIILFSFANLVSLSALILSQFFLSNNFKPIQGCKNSKMNTYSSFI